MLLLLLLLLLLGGRGWLGRGVATLPGVRRSSGFRVQASVVRDCQLCVCACVCVRVCVRVCVCVCMCACVCGVVR